MLPEQNQYSASSSLNNNNFDLQNYLNPDNDYPNNFRVPDTTYIDTDNIQATLKDINAKYSCLHLNIQSLPSKFDNLKDLLQILNDANTDIDYILMCETFLNDNN